MAGRVKRQILWSAAAVLSLALFMTLTYLISTRHSINNRNSRTLLARESSPDDTCRKVHSLPIQDQCEFINTTCSDDDGAIFYLRLFYCQFAVLKGIGLALLVAWLSLLFFAISIAASDFFSPNLRQLSELLAVGQSVAGVTFLALGNGSPDLFSTFAAISTDSGSLAVGELFGAACFITAVVAGAIACIKPFQVPRKAFVRDVGFFVVAAGFTLFALVDGEIVIWECAVLVGMYAFYVVLVVTWAYWVKDDLPYRSLPSDATAVVADAEGSEDRLPSFRSIQWDTRNTLGERTPLLDGSTPMRLSRRNTAVGITQSLEKSLGGALVLQSAVRSFRRPNERFVPLSSPNIRRHSDQGYIQRHLHVTSGPSSPGIVQALHEPRTAPPAERHESPWSDCSEFASQARLNQQLAALDLPSEPPAPRSATRTPKSVTFAVDNNFLNAPAKPSPGVSPHSQPGKSIADLPKLDTSPHLSQPADDTRLISEGTKRVSFPTSISTGSASPKEEGEEWRPSWWPNWCESPRRIAWELFPTLAGMNDRDTTWEKAQAVIAAPIFFLFLLTIPTPLINEDEEDCDCDPDDTSSRSQSTTESGPTTTHNGSCSSQQPLWKQPMEDPDWCRWITATWIFCAPALTVFALWTQSDEPLDWLGRTWLIGLGVSAALCTLMLLTTSGARCPGVYRVLIVLAGFVVSIAWVALIAAQVVGVLKALAVILDISDGIMGLTVFAVANSLGDLVANTAMARLDFPIMAFAACIGGPMLNIMLGIGLSVLTVLTRRAAKHDGLVSYAIEISPSLVMSGATLTATLVGLLMFVPLNGWTMDRRIGVSLIVLWTLSMVANVTMEVVGI